MRRRLAIMGVAAAVAVLALVGLVVLALQLLDPDRPARELALRDARAAAELDYPQLWRDYSPCWQRHNPEASWLLAQRANRDLEPSRAPADTRYSVLAVRRQGVYRRVEVRVEAPGYQQLDYEIDVRMYGGRWVKVDRGSLGHAIADDCARGQG